MKTKFIFLLLFLNTFLLFAQKKTKMYFEKKQDTIAYYVDNNDVFPVSLVFAEQPVLENMRKPETFKLIQVIPANAVKIPVIYFVITDKKKAYGIKKMPSYKAYMGDVTIKSYDSEYQYDLPFKKGNSYTVYQGYNGTFSHQNEFSLDFTMPEGTEISAAREGKIIEVVQHNNSGCATQNCANQGNYVAIMHSDGTIAQYFHLKHNGSRVKIGDEVTKGQTIASSGNTGWSNGPHLHFVCFLPSDIAPKYKKTVKTLFKTGDGSKVEYLKEKSQYTKGY